MLVQAGLGEKKVTVRDITCSAEEFKTTLVAAFPKLEGCDECVMYEWQGKLTREHDTTHYITLCSLQS